MNITLVEPFFSGSHKQWAEGLVKHSAHNFFLASLPGRHWKWRMHGGAVTLADKVNHERRPDLILATDMLDVSTFRGLLKRGFRDIPIVTYFHENQLTYPWSPDDQDVKLKRDTHYAFINYTSALASDKVVFNSNYHKSSFLDSLPEFLNLFPDYQDVIRIDEIARKSTVLPIGLELSKFDGFKKVKKNKVPVIVWNHRWEYDKNPGLFLKGLNILKNNKIDFQLVLLGEGFKKSPKEFEQIQEDFGKELVHVGFVETFDEYAHLLSQGDILPITSVQDFFGISAVEGAYSGAQPILPQRLAFPEVFDFENNKSLFYNTDEEFVEMLADRVSNAPQNKFKNSELLKYDWTKLIPKYDHFFEECLK